MRNALVTAVIAGVAAIGLSVAARGQVQTVPGPGSGLVTVVGEVVVKDGLIRAVQQGDWRVTLAAPADVRVVNPINAAALPFLKQGAQIAVTWPDNSRETVRIVQLGGGGWILGEVGAGTMWINLEGARYVRDAR